MGLLQTFLRDYWAWNVATYHLSLIGAGFLFLAVVGIFRRPMLGLGILSFGLYVSMAVFLMRNYENYGFTMEGALAMVMGGGLAAAILVFYTVLVRS
jgi:hypothetical protein